MLLEDLTEKEREFVRLYYFSGLTPDQIMRELEINRGNYDVLHARILKKLQEIARKKKIR